MQPPTRGVLGGCAFSLSLQGSDQDENRRNQVDNGLEGGDGAEVESEVDLDCDFDFQLSSFKRRGEKEEQLKGKTRTSQ
jgi:hypothetical protein